MPGRLLASTCCDRHGGVARVDVQDAGWHGRHCWLVAFGWWDNSHVLHHTLILMFQHVAVNDKFAYVVVITCSCDDDIFSKDEHCISEDVVLITIKWNCRSLCGGAAMAGIEDRQPLWVIFSDVLNVHDLERVNVNVEDVVCSWVLVWQTLPRTKGPFINTAEYRCVALVMCVR
jgi:hypothetical protein